MVPALNECLDLALAEERGRLIVALYELPAADLEKLVEAAQLIDSEGCEILDAPTTEDDRTRAAVGRARAASAIRASVERP